VTKRLYQDERSSQEWAEIDRAFERADAWQDDRHPTPCSWCGEKPAVLAGKCGRCRGMELREVSAANAKRGKAA
jgi:hypothetical protein